MALFSVEILSHRACNACGQHKAAEREARQKARLLPVPYHMVTFTIPSEFRGLFRSHQKLCYDLFFRESAAALADLAADPKHLGGEIGMTGVLQTWTRDLRYHPHIHYLVPAGALSAAARDRFARVRALLRAAESVVSLPDKHTPLCPCFAKPMTFLRCVRARGPPILPR